MSLSVAGIVRVVVNLSPLAASARSFGTLCIGGDSNVINGLERFRTYFSLETVAADFGTSAPEYFAAALYFGQVPQPRTLMIARWLRTASAGENVGGILSPTEQAMSNFTGITNGGLVIVVDGVTKTLTGLDFSAETTLNGVASVIDTALTGATVAWTGSEFIVTSATTGVSSTVGFATTGSGTNLSPILKLTSALSQGLVPGYAAETPVAFAAVMANLSPAWYGLMFQASVQPTDDQAIAVAGFIEALTTKRIYGVTITDTAVLSAVVDTDLASRLEAAGYKRSFTQYSQNAYAVASFFGRGFSVDFTAQNSTITLMFKQEPGVTGEELTESQALVLKDKRCNVFVNYDNDTIIIQYGTMAGPAFFDEIHGLDWLENKIQTECFNLLYLSKTKIPQTDAGVNQLVNACGAALDAAVNNGLVAPGIWTSSSEFGVLKTGQYLKSGYYIYAQPLALQSQSDREAREAPPIQIAAKLAGAIQSVDVVVDVNR